MSTFTQPSAGTPYVTIDFKLPSGNLSTLNMLGAGAIIDVKWDQTNAKIISVHLPAISDAFVALHGWPLSDVFVSPTVWGYMMLNTEVINSAGSANTPFEYFDYQAERQSEEIVEEARAREREIRLGAEDYADDILNTLEVNLSKFIAAVQRGRERLAGREEAEVG